jgi:hypothetical protein
MVHILIELRVISAKISCLIYITYLIQRNSCNLKLHYIENLNKVCYSISLAAELLREAEKLIDQKIHPQIIIAGWRKATQVARDALTAAAVDNR